MKSSPQESLIDVRSIPPRQKHPAIFNLWGQLSDGTSMVLVNDHDPMPLYYQFAAEHAGRFHWEYLEKGPEIWRVRIRKGTFSDPGVSPDRPTKPRTFPVHFVEPFVLDVCPLFEKGESPCEAIDQAAAGLKEGQPFILIAPFEPHPLYAKLGRDGFSRQTQKLENGTWRVEFRKNRQEEKSGGCGCSAAAPSAKTVYLDVRGLEPPDPLVKTLTTLASLARGSKLTMHSDRKPLHLLEQLEQRGFAYDCTEQADASFITEIRYADDPNAPSASCGR